MSREEWIENETIYTGKIFSVRVGKARLDNGVDAHREVVDHGGGVGIVPIVGDSVLLVRQFRIAVESVVLEIPAGRVEGTESLEHRARAELIEEVGCHGGRLELVASCYCSPGFTNEMDHIFLAHDLERTAPQPDGEENIEIVTLSADEARRMLEAREIQDAKTIIGLREWLIRR